MNKISDSIFGDEKEKALKEMLNKPITVTIKNEYPYPWQDGKWD